MDLNESLNSEHANTSISDDNPGPWMGYSPKRTVPVYIDIVEVVLSIFGMVCNLLTCCAFKLRRVKWNARLKLVCSLCIADFLIAESQFVQHTFGVTTPIFHLLNRSDFYETMFYFVQTIIYNYAQTVQQVLMMCLAVDLLIAVKNPLHYTRLMSTRRATIIITCTWLICFLCVLLQEFMSAYSSFALLWLFGIPLISSVVLGTIYLVVFCEIRKHRDRSPRTVILRKSAMTFGVIYVTYVTCMMPVCWIMFLYFASNLSKSTLAYVYQVLKCLFLVNTVCDPLVYAWRLPDLNPLLSKILTGCTCCHRENSSPVTVVDNGGLTTRGTEATNTV